MVLTFICLAVAIAGGVKLWFFMDYKTAAVCWGSALGILAIFFLFWMEVFQNEIDGKFYFCKRNSRRIFAKIDSCLRQWGRIEIMDKRQKFLEKDNLSGIYKAEDFFLVLDQTMFWEILGKGRMEIKNYNWVNFFDDRIEIVYNSRSQKPEIILSKK